MSKNYQKAVEIMAAREFNSDQIVTALAVKHPAIFVRLATGSDYGWLAMIDQLLKDGQKINAIKEWRAKHGSTLVDAKNAVEAREARLKALA